VRSSYATGGQPRTRASSADAVIIAPATYNTINKLAWGINDTYALNVATEAIGRGTPTAVLPFVNTALAARHPFQRALEALRDEGVHVLHGPDQWMPHPPGTGDSRLDAFPWRTALNAVSPTAR
jgi:glycerol dehydrogenase-like iron-containing ADH family enzyme